MQHIVISNTDISGISSKFYYKGERMVYELVINATDKKQYIKQFQNFSDFNSYHTEFLNLLQTVGIVAGMFMVLK